MENKMKILVTAIIALIAIAVIVAGIATIFLAQTPTQTIIEKKEITIAPEGTERITTDKNAIANVLNVVYVTIHYEMNDENKCDFVVYEVTLKNTGNDRIYFYPTVRAERFEDWKARGQSHARPCILDAGETGWISIWIPYEEIPYNVLTVTLRNNSDDDDEEKKIFSCEL